MRHRESTLVLVAGGAGFLGSHLCDRLLAEGHEVVCLDHFGTGRRRNLRHLEREPRFDLVTHDVVQPMPARIRRQRFARIYNLACPASPPHYQANPEHTLLTSVLGTRHLLLAAEESGARLLQASTSEIYGDPEMHPQQEGYWGHVNPTGPRACYDEGKRAAETLCADYARAGRVAVRVARIFNTYGPRMRADDGRVVSNVICQALAGDDITVYGDGSQTRSFCYVDDLIDGLWRLMEHEAEARDIGAVNLGNPVELTVSDLVRRVLAITDSPSAVVNHPLPVDDPRRRRPAITRAAEILGWAPRVPLEQGLPATVMWFSDEAEDGPRAASRPELDVPAAVVA